MVMLQNVWENCVRILEEVKKLKETGILIDKPKTPEIIAAVAETVCEAPSASIHRRPQQMNISEKTLRWILHKVLDKTPY